ncbi:hypothetical protein [uncultured Methanobrevibacter sp.]|nr:hypothetical protein [uncultured Methanobrevibacter sp.]
MANTLNHDQIKGFIESILRQDIINLSVVHRLYHYQIFSIILMKPNYV